MKAQIIRIGNSKGVRIPKAMLDAAGLELESEVDLSATDGILTIRPLRKPRSGWADAFREMAKNGDDEWIPTSSSEWDEEEWQWR